MFNITGFFGAGFLAAFALQQVGVAHGERKFLARTREVLDIAMEEEVATRMAMQKGSAFLAVSELGHVGLDLQVGVIRTRSGLGSVATSGGAGALLADLGTGILGAGSCELVDGNYIFRKQIQEGCGDRAKNTIRLPRRVV